MVMKKTQKIVQKLLDLTYKAHTSCYFSSHTKLIIINFWHFVGKMYNIIVSSKNLKICKNISYVKNIIAGTTYYLKMQRQVNWLNLGFMSVRLFSSPRSPP